uniref:Uncharacterized protein n=1 Tax=Proboscia inermis TaxID=420281 RepID=A0A7S0GHI2_9STRA
MGGPTGSGTDVPFRLNLTQKDGQTARASLLRFGITSPRAPTLTLSLCFALVDYLINRPLDWTSGAGLRSSIVSVSTGILCPDTNFVLVIETDVVSRGNIANCNPVALRHLVSQPRVRRDCRLEHHDANLTTPKVTGGM